MDINDIIKPENRVYKKPALLNDTHMHYCPGCSHGVVHKIVAELIEEMGLQDRAVGVAPVGCAVFAYNYIDVDWVEAAHGHLPLLLPSADSILTTWCSPIRATATWQPSVLAKPSMQPTAVKTSPSFSSTTLSTV